MRAAFETFGLAVLSTTGVIFGCGDSGSGGGSRGEFSAQADALCREYAEDSVQIQEEFAADFQQDAEGNPREIAVAGLTETAIPRVRQLVTDLGELDAPAELESELHSFVTEVNANLDEQEADPVQAFQQYARGKNPYESVVPIAEELGLDECLGGTSSSSGPSETKRDLSPGARRYVEKAPELRGEEAREFKEQTIAALRTEFEQAGVAPEALDCLVSFYERASLEEIVNDPRGLGKRAQEACS
jgi:hypothetical protein